MSKSLTQNHRVAIYARVSTEEQREGQTIDSQVAELERFADDQGWAVAGIYKDEGWSGSILARPALDRLRDEANQGRFSLVLLNDVDRLARDVAHLGIIKRDLERRGVQVRFRKLPAEQSPTANLMVNILGSFAEFERELIADRTRRGRRHKVEVRQQFLGAIPAYGYRYIPKDQATGREGYLEVVPEQATVVRQIYDWVDRDSLSAHGVVNRLNELRVKPQKGGRRWGKSSVLRILHTEIYTGIWHYNKYEGREPKRPVRATQYRHSLKSSVRLRPREEWIPVRLPGELQIIERSQWERVQVQLARNRAFSPRNTKHSYLLRGLIYCGGCGSRYVGDPNHGRFYYRCLARCKRLSSVREESIDGVVWEAVREAILHPEIIAKQIADRNRRSRADAAKTGSELAEVEQAVKGVESEESRIIEAYRMAILSPSQLGQQLEALRHRQAVLEARKTVLEGKSNLPDLSTIRHSLEDYCRRAAERLDAFTLEERQQFLRLLIQRIVYDGDRVKIEGVIPLSPPLEDDITPIKAEEANAEPLINDSRVYPSRRLERTIVRHQIGEIRRYDFTTRSGFPTDRIEDMEFYSNGRNSVNHFLFEVTKSGFQRRPTWNSRRLARLRRHVARNPKAPLRELCDWMHRRHGVRVSITEMSRTRIRLGFRRNR